VNQAPIRENSPSLTDSQVIGAKAVASPLEMSEAVMALRCPVCQGPLVVKTYKSLRRVPYMYCGVDLYCESGHQTPCNCSGVSIVGGVDACPPRPTTLCDRYDRSVPNVWVEGDPGAIGVCMLDTMTEEQIIYCIERDDKARMDLLKVTSDPGLLELARKIASLPTTNETDGMQALLNKNNSPASIPFYGLFRGQPPFNQ
jgi:hypothetical protein